MTKLKLILMTVIAMACFAIPSTAFATDSTGMIFYPTGDNEFAVDGTHYEVDSYEDLMVNGTVVPPEPTVGTVEHGEITYLGDTLLIKKDVVEPGEPNQDTTFMYQAAPSGQTNGFFFWKWWEYNQTWQYVEEPLTGQGWNSLYKNQRIWDEEYTLEDFQAGGDFYFHYRIETEYAGYMNTDPILVHIDPPGPSPEEQLKQAKKEKHQELEELLTDVDADTYRDYDYVTIEGYVKEGHDAVRDAETIEDLDGIVEGVAENIATVPTDEERTMAEEAAEEARQAEIDELTEEYEGQLADMEADYEAQIAQLDEEHQAEIDEITADYEAQLAEMQSDYEAEIARINAHYREVIEQLMSDFEKNDKDMIKHLINFSRNNKNDVDYSEENVALLNSYTTEALGKVDTATSSEQLLTIYEKYVTDIDSVKTLKQQEAEKVTQMGEDGTAFGKGASYEANNAAILALTDDTDPIGSKILPLKVTSSKQGKNSITLKYTDIRGAEKYVIYGNKCGTKMKKITTTSLNTVTVKKLKKNSYNKFIVVALDKDNNVISTSKVVHVATKGKYKNYSKVTVSNAKSFAGMEVGKVTKIKAKAVGKKVKKHAKLRYESTNEAVATVDAQGYVTAVGSGDAKIIVYSQNGKAKTIKISVK